VEDVLMLNVSGVPFKQTSLDSGCSVISGAGLTVITKSTGSPVQFTVDGVTV
jgi:hypothetical protein